MKFENILKKIFKHKTIYRADHSLYLTRYYIFRKPVRWMPSLYLHCFHSSDADFGFLHDHGWEYSCSLILKGSYQEEYRVGDNVKSRILSPGKINFIKSSKFHRVDLITPKVWTLLFSGWKKKDWTWGFWDRNTKQYWSHEDFEIMKKNRNIP